LLDALQEKVTHARALVDAGVPELEVGKALADAGNFAAMAYQRLGCAPPGDSQS